MRPRARWKPDDHWPSSLPANTTDLLKTKQNEGIEKGQPLRIKVFLGYFDDLPAFRSVTAEQVQVSGQRVPAGKDVSGRLFQGERQPAKFGGEGSR